LITAFIKSGGWTRATAAGRGVPGATAAKRLRFGCIAPAGNGLGQGRSATVAFGRVAGRRGCLARNPCDALRRCASRPGSVGTEAIGRCFGVPSPSRDHFEAVATIGHGGVDIAALFWRAGHIAWRAGLPQAQSSQQRVGISPVADIRESGPINIPRFVLSVHSCPAIRAASARAFGVSNWVVELIYARRTTNRNLPGAWRGGSRVAGDLSASGGLGWATLRRCQKNRSEALQCALRGRNLEDSGRRRPNSLWLAPNVMRGNYLWGAGLGREYA
jgi:hypothetical protein